jgi:hypothetical protein
MKKSRHLPFPHIVFPINHEQQNGSRHVAHFPLPDLFGGTAHRGTEARGLLLLPSSPRSLRHPPLLFLLVEVLAPAPHVVRPFILYPLCSL